MLPRLLIAEDDAQLRDVLTRTLREEGFEARGVATGRELLELSSSTPPDALVVDIGLPDSDGRDLCQALRSQGINAPVLFLTARDALVDRLGGFGAGGDDYVTKPFDLEELVARLRALLRRAGVEPATEVAGLQPGAMPLPEGGSPSRSAGTGPPRRAIGAARTDYTGGRLNGS
jgi:two-component system OmpR family response regulator